MMLYHFFKALRAYSLGQPLKGSTDGLPLSIDLSNFSEDFSNFFPFSTLTSLSFQIDLFTSYSFLASFNLLFFWYLRICCAANSKMFASGRPFLQMALRKYSQASRMPDFSRTLTGQDGGYFFAGPRGVLAPCGLTLQPCANVPSPSPCPSCRPSFPSLCSSQIYQYQITRFESPSKKLPTDVDKYAETIFQSLLQALDYFDLQSHLKLPKLRFSGNFGKIDAVKTQVVILEYQKSMLWYFLCSLSQNGPFLLLLQRHRILSDCVAVNLMGVNLVPSWDPSQKGWVLESPQLQQSYSLPTSSRNLDNIDGYISGHGLTIYGFFISFFYSAV